MHEYGGFFINLPYAYMSRQFPLAFDAPCRGSGPSSLLAMHLVTDPTRCRKAFRRLESLLDLARSRSRVKGKDEQMAWRRKYDVAAKDGWIWRSEQ